MTAVRPNWRTLHRRDLRARPVALAARPGVCSDGQPVEADEPIALLGSVTVQETDGTKHVDLSGAEWHPQQCLGGRS